MSLLPSRIPIAGQSFEIEFSLEVTDSFGESDGDARKITIHKSLDRPDKLQEATTTVAHEIIHASLFMSGLSFKMEDAEEEALVRMFEHIALPALRTLIRAEYDAETS